ncbi:MAG: hypothetical protein ACREMQ_11270, partial [Longimicrobiales bacterium]
MEFEHVTIALEIVAAAGASNILAPRRGQPAYARASYHENQISSAADMPEPLFSQSSGKEPGPARQSESHYAYLCRSSRATMAKCRQLMNTWFVRYPGDAQLELRRRISSGDDQQFAAAFFELYLHELFRCLGYTVEVHPTATAGRRPDFLLRARHLPEAYLEAAVSTSKSAKNRAVEARIAAVYDAINSLPSPDFFIWLNARGAPASPPPAARFRDTIHGIMASLDVRQQAALLESSGVDALPRFHLEHDGWSLEFFFFPKSESAHGQSDTQPIGVYGSGEAQWVDSRSPLLNTVLKKASRYGDLEHPYIIAVNTLGFPLQNIDVMEALFGKEQVTVYFAGDEIHSQELTRRPDGALTTFSGPRSTRVSAVFHVSTIFPWSVA